MCGVFICVQFGIPYHYYPLYVALYLVVCIPFFCMMWTLKMTLKKWVVAFCVNFANSSGTCFDFLGLVYWGLLILGLFHVLDSKIALTVYRSFLVEISFVYNVWSLSLHCFTMIVIAHRLSSSELTVFTVFRSKWPSEHIAITWNVCRCSEYGIKGNIGCGLNVCNSALVAYWWRCGECLQRQSVPRCLSLFFHFYIL